MNDGRPPEDDELDLEDEWDVEELGGVDPTSPGHGGASPFLHFFVLAVGGCATIGFLGFVGALIWGALYFNSDAVPDGNIQSGHALNPHAQELLEEENLVPQGETVIYYVADGTFSHRESGVFFTDRRVVTYFDSNGELSVESVAFTDVESIDIQPPYAADQNFRVSIQMKTGGPMIFYVDKDQELEYGFTEKLISSWESARGW